MKILQQYRGVVIVFILASFILPVNIAWSQVLSVPSPIITAIDLSSDKVTRPLVTGLTHSNTDVLVYLDQEFVGLAEVNTSDTLTDNYYWQPEESLTVGTHSVSVVARDRTSLLLSPMSGLTEFNVLPLPAPILIEPNEESVIGTPKPVITGLAPSNSVVNIFIDGVINGNTGTLMHDSGTANFSYKPFLNLSIGEHEIWAVATDEYGRQSILSNVFRFQVENPMPAPVLFSPVINNSSTTTQPWITGLAKNNSKIRVFIDNQLNGEFKVENSSSGTADFAYKPFLSLTSGEHLIYVTAVDERGKESQWSNLIGYQVGDRALPQISESAATDEEPIVLSEELILSNRLKELIILARLFAADNEIVVSEVQLSELRSIIEQLGNLNVTTEERQLLENLLQSDEGKMIISEEGPEVDNPERIDKDSELDEILGSDEPEEAAKDTGMIDESQERQGRLRLNLVIFILFLLAVIIWIFWVNRELIKERREQNDNDKDPSTDSTPQSDSPRPGSGRAGQASSLRADSGQAKKEKDQNKFDI